jgi:transcriptional regulator with XRE-family HTH domain
MIREGRGYVPETAHEEGVRVARQLARWIKDHGYNVNEVEKKVGWGQKTLWQVLNGSQPLRVSHIAAVAEAVGFEVSEFYRDLAGETGQGEKKGKRRRRKDEGEERPSKEIAPGLNEEDLLKAFRDFLREWKRPEDKES